MKNQATTSQSKEQSRCGFANKWRFRLPSRRSINSDTEDFPIPSLPHSSKRKSPQDSRVSVGVKAQNNKGKASRYIIVGRLLFVLCLALAAALLSYLSWKFLTESERKLADSHFDSLAERALTEAASVMITKRWSAITLASVVAEIHPDPESWPFVMVPGYGRISQHLLNTTQSQAMALLPVVQPDELIEWEKFILNYYEKHGISSPLAKYAGGTWKIDGGDCVWGISDVDCGGNFSISRDLGPDLTNWTAKNLLTPVSQSSEEFHPFSLYNIHSHLPHGQAIDRVIDCIGRTAKMMQKQDRKLIQKTLDYSCATLPQFTLIPTFVVSGPASIIFQPVRAGDDSDPKVRLSSIHKQNQPFKSLRVEFSKQ